MKIIDEYLQKIQEGFVQKIKDFLKKMYYNLSPVEPIECKEWRLNNNHMYLYHGTRPWYVDSIKKEGLLVSHFKKRAKEEGDITIGSTPSIFMINSINKKDPGFGGLGISKKVVFVLCKVESKNLKWIGYCYVYTKDVPVKDIIWENDKRFKNIENKYKYLKNN